MTELSARELAIVRLLETRDEGLPLPVRRADAAAGFVHKARSRSCPDCLANGRTMIGCETCGGSGVVEGGRFERVAAPDALPSDGVQRDPYAENKIQPYGFDGTGHDAVRERDRQIEILDRQLRPARTEAELLEEANREPYAWERARARMYKLFDYEALDRALDDLRAHDPIAYRALHAVYVYGWLSEVSGAAEAAVERGLAFLSARLAAFELAQGRKLRAPGAEPEKRVRGPLQRGGGAGLDARELRDAELRQRAAVLVEAGALPSEVTAALAQEFRVSVRTVYRVVNEAA